MNPRGGLSPPTRLAGEHLRPLGQPSGIGVYERPAGAPDGYLRGVTPVEALERIAGVLMRGRGAVVPACRRSGAPAREVARVPDDELRRLAEAGRLTDIPGVGEKTAAVIAEALSGETPTYLRSCSARRPSPAPMRAKRCAAQLKGDLHSHSDWSDGGDTIAAMAGKARDLGHEYLALTDHSPRSEDRQRALGRPAARAARSGRARSTTSSRRSASSPASRSTSSKTARSTSTKSCSRASTSWSRACTRSCAWKPTR